MMGDRFLGNISVCLFEKMLVLLLTRREEEHGEVEKSEPC